MVPFAGYNMPVQYEGVTVEHLCVRSGVGEFDVSHITIDENDQTEHQKFLEFLSKKSKQEINW